LYQFVAFNIAYHKNFVSDFFETLKYKFHMFENKGLHHWKHPINMNPIEKCFWNMGSSEPIPFKSVKFLKAHMSMPHKFMALGVAAPWPPSGSPSVFFLCLEKIGGSGFVSSNS
jgi:hypothetical protein